MSEEDEGLEEIELVYVGVCESPKGYTWRDGTDLRVYGKLRGRVPGGVYTIQGKRPDEDTLSIFPGTLQYTGRRTDDAAELQVREDAREQARKVARLHTGTGRSQDIDDALVDLLKIADRLQWQDRRALASYVSAKIQSA